MTRERIVDQPIVEEVEDAYLDYAMSVIVSRALPDARDGLKPVQRRILYTMYEGGNYPDRPHRKVSKSVGEVMGNYHPHGDAAISDALVRLGQDFNLRVPFVDGQGNFGSLDDNPAAPRYIEARLSEAAMAALADLGEGTVDWKDNYSGDRQEPVVLPMRIPNLIVNGAAGIAVGMATNMVPHNLAEVAEAATKLLLDPKIADGELLASIKGPDFPGGGIVVAGEGLKDAYRTGKGWVVVRGVVEVEKAGRTTNLVITELPYMVGPEKFISRVVEAVQDKKLEGIRNIVNHTDRKSGMRVVIELKNGVDPAAVTSLLYKHTPLQEKISIQQVALVDNQPRSLTMRQLLEVWVDHQIDVIVRRSRFRLDKAERRIHLVNGLLLALDRIDEVVATIRRSRTTDTARQNLRKLLKLDVEQVNYILEMPLRRLTSLEVSKLQDEKKELEKTIRALKKLLGSEKAQRKAIAEELDCWVAKLGTPRRSRIVTKVEELVIPETVEAADEPCVVTATTTGLVGRDVGGRRQNGADDVLVARIDTTTNSEVFVIASNGTAHRLPARDLPEARGKSRGARASSFLGTDGRVVGLFSATDLEAGRIPAFITRDGVVKRVRPDDLSKMTEVSLISLEDGDEVAWASAVPEAVDLVFVTASGQVLRTPADKVRPQGRNGGGMAGIKLADGDEVIAGGWVPADADTVDVVVVTDANRVKATSAAEYPQKGRATGGVRTIRFLKGESRLVSAWVGPKDAWAPVTADGTHLETVERAGRDSSGTLVEGVVAVGESR